LLTKYQLLLLVSQQQQDNHNQQKQSHSAGRIVAPLTAIRPPRLNPQKKYDQDDQQDQHSNFDGSSTIRVARQKNGVIAVIARDLAIWAGSNFTGSNLNFAVNIAIFF